MKYIHIAGIIGIIMAAGGIMSLSSCNDYLNKEPLSSVTPEQYFNDEAALQNYANNFYNGMLPSHGSYGGAAGDIQTDNMSALDYDSGFVPGKRKTSLTNGNWSFSTINSINYFFEQLQPKYDAGAISGSQTNIDHYMGEMHLFRALAYYSRLVQFGDFPIITECLPDDWQTLTDASRRYPRNEVARFIIGELDKAIELMQGHSVATTRVSENVALLYKSRIALFEGSWLKNFSGTPFVPGDPQWPGYSKDYNKDFSFQGGSIESEYNWFFDQAMDAGKKLGDQMIGNLTPNTGIVPQEEGMSLAEIEAANPYLYMFAAYDLSKYKEVILWREYSDALQIYNGSSVYAQSGNCGYGTTRSMVESYLMSNGMPIYAPGSGYAGDNTIHDVRVGRDPRLVIFLKEPGQKNILIPGNGSHTYPIEEYPRILDGAYTVNYSTGYALRKYNSFESNQNNNLRCWLSYPSLRGVEAMLNYIEACYERTGNIDGTADSYWREIRSRNAGMEPDYRKTIAATDMEREARLDWAAYTAGKIIDPVRFNIRRERRNEFIAEGYRWNDIVRWRSLDQMCDKGYHIEGMHLWGTPMEEWYDHDLLVKTISPSSLSEYIRPNEAKANSEVMDGLKWTMAHYLNSLPIKQFMLTAPDGATITDSPLYQNPYWPTEVNAPAEK